MTTLVFPKDCYKSRTKFISIKISETEDQFIYDGIAIFSGSRTCLYNGKTYSDGAEFLAVDGCNECECDNGVLECSTDICTPQGIYI